MQDFTAACIPDLLSQLDEVASGGHSVGLQIRGSMSLFFETNFPQSWLDHYKANGYLLRDPVIAWAMSEEGVKRWVEIADLLPDPFNIWEQAIAHGMRFGVAVSIGPVVSRSIISCMHPEREFSDDEISEIYGIAQKLHLASKSDIGLTQAQAEALACVARGDRHAQAAAALGISESAFKARLASARGRLCARTTSEAVQKAKAFRLI